MLSFFRFFRQHWKRILLRAHKDKRSLSALLMMLGIVGYCLYEGFLLYKNPLSLVILCLAAIAAWRIRKSHEKDDELLIRLSDYEPVTIQPSASGIASLRSQMMRLWLLLWRASSEQFLAEKSLPDGTEILTRRTVLDKLNELGLMEELDDRERQLHLIQDGGWSREDALECIFRTAELEALQYRCNITRTLSPMEDFYRIPRIQMDYIRTVAKDTAVSTRETSDIRQERDMAAAFYLRVFGEQLRRGLDKPFADDQQRILAEATASAGDHNSDFLLGTQIISEVEQDKLNIAVGQAYLRLTTLHHALALLEATVD